MLERFKANKKDIRTISNDVILTLNNIEQRCRALALSCRRPLSYRNQSIDLQSKSMDWFLYDNDLRLERVNLLLVTVILDRY